MALESKALVWKWNVKSQYISCVEAELRDFQALFLEAACQTLNSHSILCAEAELRNLKFQYSGDRN